MSNTGNTQQIIDYGAAANDGQGDPLRTAFIKTDENFDNIWLAGPVGSNITIVNNTIQNDSTNGNIIIKPNGIGIVQSNAHVVPNTTDVRNLGAADLRWRTLYVGIGGINSTGNISAVDLSVSGDIDVGGNVLIEGNLIVEGDTIEIGNITTDSLTIQLANTAANAAQADGSGVTVGANDDIATMLYDSTANVWEFNIGIKAPSVEVPSLAAPNITVNNISSDDSTVVTIKDGLNVEGDAEIQGAVTANAFIGKTLLINSISSDDSSFVSITDGLSVEGDINSQGNITADYFIGDGSLLTNIDANNVIGLANVAYTGDYNDLINTPNFGNLTVDILTTGNITGSYIVGNGSQLTDVDAHTLEGAPADYSAIPDTIVLRDPNGNITGNYFIGDGSQLTGMYGNANVIANLAALSSNPVSTTGNISAAYFFGDGSQLTGMYGNTNVVANLAALSSNPISTTGNIAAEYFVGNGSLLTGTYSNANVSAYGEAGWTGNIIPSANAQYSLGNSSNQWSNLWVANNTIYLGGVPLGVTAGNVLTVDGEPILSNSSNVTISTSGNITADYYFGNGSQLTGMYGNTNVVDLLANLNNNSISTTGTVTGGNLYTTGSLTSGPQTITGNIDVTGNINVTGNLNYANVNEFVVGDPLIYLGANNTGNLYDLGMVVSYDDGLYQHGGWVRDASDGTWKLFGNVVAEPTTIIDFANAVYQPMLAGLVSATGNIIGTYIFGNGSQLTGVYGNADMVANLAALSSNPISTSGNITGSYIFGNGSQLTSVNAVTVDVTDTNGLTTVYYPTFVENRTNAQMVRADADLSYRTDNNTLTVGNISSTGNITGAYILGNGSQLTGLPASYGDSNVVILLTSYGSNTISTSGNITGNYILGNGSQLTGLPATYGNANVVANLAALSSNPISTSGNITGGYILGNGSQLTGVATLSFTTVSANGTSLVADSAADTLTVTPGNNMVITGTAGNDTVTFAVSESPTFSGTVTAQSFSGNISVTGNVTGTSSNVNIIAGSYQWSFDNTGNLVLAGNTFAVNYANGTAVSLGGGTYGNANVVANLAALSSNPISTTGNVTASYFFGNISQATGGYGNANVVANLAALSSNPVSTTGNVTAGNIIITGNTTTGINAVTVGVNNVILPNTIASFSSNVNNYTQLTLENTNNGADATADFILTADNGNDTVNYGDFGIINSGYDPNTPTNSLGNIVYAADTYIYAQGNTSNTAQAGGNLVLGVTTASKNIKLFAGGANTSALIATVSNAGITMNSGNITGNTAGFAIGYRDIPQVSFVANATISTSDAGKHYYSTSASNLVLTIANNASQAFAIGAAINIINRGTGTMTIAQGSGVTLYLAGNTTAGNRTLSSYGAATIQKVESDVWFVVGTGLT